MGKNKQSEGTRTAASRQPSDYGRFDGPVRAKWLPDGRLMCLLEPLVFHQGSDGDWTAPAKTLTDGASIPQVFWALIGGPFEGKYRDAAVCHDFQCCVKTRPWQLVHRMFFDAMMANGEALWRAKLMYFAVYFFGPRWPSSERRPDRGFTEGDIARAAHWFKRSPNISLESIEGLTRQKLRSSVPAVPRTIRGAKLLDDSKKIRPVDRDGPCIQEDCC
jgi:hypothetical protein